MPMWIRLAPFLLCVAVLGGCDAPPQADKPSEHPRPSPTRFDPSTAGDVHGRVTWSGDLPEVPPLAVSPLPTDEVPKSRPKRPHPNAPRIDPATRGVAGAVVSLRGVDPQRARPWDFPAVRVEMRDRQFRVLQGDSEARVGFVRRGDEVEMVSREAVFHVLRADGDAFFSLAFPEANKPGRRRLEKKGLVELSSGAGYYWMRAYLFVDDQPYYTLTDAGGNFVLPAVPPGRYEAVCWLPSWREARHSRDPETGLVTRVVLDPPVEHGQRVEVAPRGSAGVDFTFATTEFLTRAAH